MRGWSSTYHSAYATRGYSNPAPYGGAHAYSCSYSTTDCSAYTSG